MLSGGCGVLSACETTGKARVSHKPESLVCFVYGTVMRRWALSEAGALLWGGMGKGKMKRVEDGRGGWGEKTLCWWGGGVEGKRMHQERKESGHDTIGISFYFVCRLNLVTQFGRQKT